MKLQEEMEQNWSKFSRGLLEVYADKHKTATFWKPFGLCKKLKRDCTYHKINKTSVICREEKDLWEMLRDS